MYPSNLHLHLKHLQYTLSLLVYFDFLFPYFLSDDFDQSQLIHSFPLQLQFIFYPILSSPLLLCPHLHSSQFSSHHLFQIWPTTSHINFNFCWLHRFLSNYLSSLPLSLPPSLPPFLPLFLSCPAFCDIYHKSYLYCLKTITRIVFMYGWRYPSCDFRLLQIELHNIHLNSFLRWRLQKVVKMSDRSQSGKARASAIIVFIFLSFTPLINVRMISDNIIYFLYFANFTWT